MKNYDLITVGFPMVEIMRKKRGVSFSEVGEFVGPYPSADTCIMLDVATRLGTKCAMLGVAADDTFGRVVTDRLQADGVDISHMRVIPGMDTTIVFVRYEPDGTREYLPSFADTVNAQFCVDDIDPDVAADTRCVHFSGEVIMLCSRPGMREGILKLLHSIPEDTLVSLDPNFDGVNDEMRQLMKPFIERADIVFPSEGEAGMMLGMDDDVEACRKMASEGKIAALKRGKDGCDIFSREGVCHIDAFPVEEIDPTGCGDSFCAGFLTGLLEGMDIQSAGTLANAAGALQATGFGPMEGVLSRKQAEDFLSERNAR